MAPLELRYHVYPSMLVSIPGVLVVQRSKWSVHLRNKAGASVNMILCQRVSEQFDVGLVRFGYGNDGDYSWPHFFVSYVLLSECASKMY